MWNSLPQLERLERGGVEQRREPLHRGVLADDHALLRRHPGAGEIGSPVDAGRVGDELGGRIGVVDLLDLAPVGGIPAELGDHRLERQHLGCGAPAGSGVPIAFSVRAIYACRRCAGSRTAG